MGVYCYLFSQVPVCKYLLFKKLLVTLGTFSQQFFFMEFYLLLSRLFIKICFSKISNILEIHPPAACLYFFLWNLSVSSMIISKLFQSSNISDNFYVSWFWLSVMSTELHPLFYSPPYGDLLHLSASVTGFLYLV